MGVIPSADENSPEELLNAEQQGQGAIPRAIDQVFSVLRLHQSNTADQAYGTLSHHAIACHTFKLLSPTINHAIDLFSLVIPSHLYHICTSKPRIGLLSSDRYCFHLIGCLSNVRVSMLEIYNDECRDLLHPEIPSRDIALREDKEGRMFFTGAREEIVADKKVWCPSVRPYCFSTSLLEPCGLSHMLILLPSVLGI